MPENMADIILFAVIFAFMSVTYIVSGLRILTAKKPFIVNLRHQIILNAPTVASILYIVWPKYPQQSLLPMVMAIGGMIVVCGINLWQLRGGVVIGTSGDVLNDAVRQAFRRLSLPFEESVQTFRLSTLNNILIPGMTLLNGVFILRYKNFDRSLIRRLAQEIKDCLGTAPALNNRRFGYGLVVIGALILIAGSWVTSERLSFYTWMRAQRKVQQSYFRSPEKAIQDHQ